MLHTGAHVFAETHSARAESLLDIIAFMSLESGQTLAHYEIVEPIGKGGMGEVFRAKGKKLGRDVAIKVLPEEFAETPSGSPASSARPRFSLR